MQIYYNLHHGEHATDTYKYSISCDIIQLYKVYT